MRILGISAYYHDSAAALVEDGRVVAAAQEERFTRIKHDARFPSNAIEYCLAQVGITARSVDYVVFYEKPYRKFRRVLSTFVRNAPLGLERFHQALSAWLGDRLHQRRRFVETFSAMAPEADWDSRILFTEHHQSHAASAFYPSPFDRAAVVTLDGVGEWATTSVAVGDGAELSILKEIHFPDSLGLLYAAFTDYTGFKVNSGEYKMMGLAPYGVPRYAGRIHDQLIDLKADGSFSLDQSYFDYQLGRRMTSARFHDLFDGPPRRPQQRITQRHMDLAASIQVVVEEAVLRLCRSVALDTGERDLCLAGGVALNCVANGRLEREGLFERIWIQPASGDAGGALGAALAAYYAMSGAPRTPSGGSDAMSGAYLGPEYAQDEIEGRLEAAGARVERLDGEALIERAVDDLERGHAVGWFQGRMEFGPRALGGRSILGDPRSPSMQRNLNVKVKFRESFRPFAPSVREEDASEWFELEAESPYMLLVANVRRQHRREMTPAEQALFGIAKLNVPRSSIPAVTHVDYSARVQTVSARTNPVYHRLLTRFKERTGCPVLVNTSFNVRGEPIVCTPEDAFRCFMGTNMDSLYVGSCRLDKSDQVIEADESHRHAFAPD